MYKREDLFEQLNTFSEALGHHVHVHSSLKAIGEVEGRGETVLQCLIDYFTQSRGMVSFPTHTWDTNVLDLNKTDTCVGMLSKLALQRADGVRTLNPTHSMKIFGEKAKAYAKWDESVTSSTAPNGCYGKLYEEDGYIMLAGVGQNANTYIHSAEESLEIPDRVTQEQVDTVIIDTDGQHIVRPMHLVFEEYGDISAYFNKLEPAFLYHGCIIDGEIGDAKVQLCRVCKMYDVLKLIHEKSGYRELFLDDKPLQKEWYTE